MLRVFSAQVVMIAVIIYYWIDYVLAEHAWQMRIWPKKPIVKLNIEVHSSATRTKVSIC